MTRLPAKVGAVARETGVAVHVFGADTLVLPAEPGAAQHGCPAAVALSNFFRQTFIFMTQT